jgi:hypothetical protein
MTDAGDEEFNFKDFLCGDDTALEFNVADFNITDGIDAQSTRYIKPVFYSKPAKADYKNAKQLVNEIHLALGEQFHAIVRGDFIFGDFLEALVYEKNVIVKNMHLSTLSMSQNNIDSLAGMLEDNRIENLTLVLSNYFYSHEKRILIPYAMEKLDIKDNFDLLIIRNHTKICLMEIGNLKLIMSGSANLRSSESIEQFVLQENADLYSFYLQWFTDNRQHSIINREVKK